jgi:hypothetical protein
VRATARLQIHAVDLEQANAPHAARRLDRHGAHQLGLGVQLLVGDPDGADVVRLGHQARQLALQVIAIERLDHVEIEARVIGGDGAAVGRVRDDGAQQVRRGVEAHVAVAPLPVDLRPHVSPGRSGASATCRIRPSALMVSVTSRRRRRRAPELRHPRLPPAARVEHGAVEDDPLRIARDHPGLGGRGVRVVAIELVGHENIVARAAGGRGILPTQGWPRGMTTLVDA